MNDSTDPSLPHDPLRIMKDITSNLSAARNCDILLYAGPITPQGATDLQQRVSERPHKKQSALLFISTLGGNPDAAYKIARCLQDSYEDGFTLAIDEQCKSAGTLLAIGAQRLIMHAGAELGPLDIQIHKSDELWETMSGLTTIEALTTLRSQAQQAFRSALLDIRGGSQQQISTRTAAELAAKVVTGLFAPIYGKIDPMLLGEHSRAMRIARAYGERLLEKSKNTNDIGIRKLATSYPSHEFVIDRIEAKSIFSNVDTPCELTTSLFAEIRPILQLGVSVSDPMVFYLDQDDDPADTTSADSTNDPASNSTQSPAHGNAQN